MILAMSDSLRRIEHLPWNAPLAAYEAQAASLWNAYRAGDPDAMKLFHNNLPRFLNPEIPWLARDVAEGEIENAALTLDDARLAVARIYSYRDWNALTSLVTAVDDETSSTHEFERAVEAVITGDAPTLRAMLDANPALIRARSVRETCHDPPLHRATLLHYTAANGVEGYRQKSPPNAEEIARMLLEAGAPADALAGMYGAECTTLSMLVSSSPPAAAGVQVPVTIALLDHGANPNGAGHGNWQSPLVTALVFAFHDAARTLVARGASVDTVEKAAGIGDLARCRALLATSTERERHAALSLSAICGHTAVVRFLIASGEDPNRLNPEGHHSHSTPLHQATCAGHLDTVKALVELGARTDTADTVWHGDPLGWAEHCEQPHVAAYLRTVTARARRQVERE